MASWTVTKMIAEAAELGITVEQINDALPVSYNGGLVREDGPGAWITMNRAGYDRVADYLATAQAATKPAPKPEPVVEWLATERQVDYIMSLIASGARDEGGFYYGPTTRAQVAKLTRGQASTYITSLKTEY